MKTLDDLLAEFPSDWDVQVCVCCRGETFNGPRGMRRWTATAVPKMRSPEEILAGNPIRKERLESECSDTPREAVMELIKAIGQKTDST